MNEFLNQITTVVAPYIPRIFSALLILVVGWIVALLVGAIVRGALKRTTLDNRLAAWLAGEKANTMDVEGWAGKGRPITSSCCLCWWRFFRLSGLRSLPNRSMGCSIRCLRSLPEF